MSDRVHIKTDKLKELVTRGIRTSEDMACMEHINQCDSCLMAYTSEMEHNLLSLPLDFKEEVMKKAKKERVFFEKGQESFYGYCFRVGLACACSIILLFTFDSSKIYSLGNKMEQIRQEEGMIQTEIDSIFKKILNPLEVFYEKEKK